MRERKLIPETHQQWLNDYLARKGIKSYPDLDAKQWRLLQAAYRQVLLKERKPLNNALSNEAKLLAENTRLKEKLTRLEQTSLIAPDKDNDLLTHNAVLVSERDKARAELLTLENKLISKGRVIEENKALINALKAKLRKCTAPILGEGAYDGEKISLAMAVKMLDSVPKDANKQPAIRNEARINCGYGDIPESKLSPAQKVEIYNYIEAKYKSVK